MSFFEVAKLAITQDNQGNLEVLPTTVRWRGRQSFSTHASDPTCGSDPLPPGLAFATDPSVPDPAHPAKFRTATLKFTGAIEPSWHHHYNECHEITQLMDVGGGVGPKELKIQLSCVVHPKLALLNHLEHVVHAPARAAVAVVQFLFMLFRRLFGTPKKLGPDSTPSQLS